MSTKYPGGFITKSPVAPTTSAASGIWTLDQQQQAQKAGTWPSPPIFIEDLFSTYLVTGDGTAPAVNNGIDVSGQGGLVWIKKRSAAGSHDLFDTARGANLRLISNDTAAQDSKNLSFTSTGFSNYTFDSAVTYASWTFREQPKFFDIVTYTGNGSARTIAHNLGSTPGCIIVKSTDGAGQNWCVYHRSVGAGNYLYLNTSAAQNADTGIWNNTAPTSSVFSVGGSGYNVNDSGFNYVAYLFAHDAGGFPVSGGGSTNGISCGSYTGNGSASGPTVTLGYEPQWLMVKRATGGTGNWVMIDSMRGFVNSTTATPSDAYLVANTSAAESTWGAFTGTENAAIPLATGFQIVTSTAALNASAGTYIYIAIRRGPMKPPTVGTSVYNGIARTGTGATATVSGVGFPPDLFIGQIRGTAGYWNGVVDRLRGVNKRLVTSQTNAEDTTTDAVTSFTMDGVTLGADSNGFVNESGKTYIEWNFRRAPGFFDEVCYTGNGATQTLTHNLGVAPELMIVKKRSIDGTSNWAVYAAPLANADAYLFLNDTAAVATSSVLWNSTAPTSTVFSLGASTNINQSGQTAVAYLFATLAGISKVGSYTGTGALQTVNCGFTAGARFVLIKRTDSTGDWFTYDSARGITSSNDPYLLLNSTAAEVTGTNYVDTDTTGFQVTAAAPAGINASGGTYIFLAIA